MTIDKQQFIRSGHSYYGTYVGPVINSMAAEDGETRQPWEILRDELPDLLDFSSIVPEGADFIIVKAPLDGLRVEKLRPTNRHKRERTFTLKSRYHSASVDKHAREWVDSVLGEGKLHVDVPVLTVSTTDAPIAMIIDYTDIRYYGKSHQSDVYRWYAGKLWQRAEVNSIENHIRNHVNSECLARLISEVLSLTNVIVVGDEQEVWVEATEKLITLGNVDWGKVRSRHHYETDNDAEWREGFTNPVHFLELSNVHTFASKAGRDDWTDYFALSQIDEALAAVNAQHAEFNAAVGEGEKQIEAVCPFQVTVYRPEALQFKRGPRPGEIEQLDLKCPVCGKEMVECAVKFTVEPMYKLEHGKLTDRYVYLDSTLTQPFSGSRPLFQFIQCRECSYRIPFTNLQRVLDMPIDREDHTAEYTDRSMLLLLEIVASYLDEIGDDSTEDIQHIVENWREAIE